MHEKLITALRELAEWAETNIWEVINMPDDCTRAADTIKCLDEARERANDKAHEFEGRCKMLEEQLEQVKRERDAAVADIKELLQQNDWINVCWACKYGETKCNSENCEEAEWRGVKETAE